MRWIVRAIVGIVLPMQLAAQTLDIAAPPAWVEDVALPDASQAAMVALRARASGGVLAHLVDSQIIWEGEERLVHYRLVQEVTDRAGLETAATVQHEFDPAYETLTLTRLDVIRDGDRIGYRDAVTPDIVRRETRLEDGILDGTLTAIVQVPGLRVGDIVDYSFVRRERPVFKGSERAVFVALEFDEPSLLTRHVGNWPADWPFVLGDLPDRVKHDVDAGTEVVRHIFTRAGNVPPRFEDRTPADADVYAEVQYGTSRDWGEALGELAAFYRSERDIPAAWADRVAEIGRRHAAPGARAIAALRLVQDEIRYVGIEIGAGGYFARDPAVVVAQTYGDCKDKALLLRTILRRLGIAAEVALTDLDQGYDLPNMLPSVGAFDHMIVRAEIEGQVHWMDPTLSHQGGSIDVAVAPDYGYALALGGTPAGRGELRLEPIWLTRAMAWGSSTTERFQFTPLGVLLNVSSRMTGAAADSRRYDWATDARAEIDDGFLRFYEARYPGILRVAPLAVEDRRDGNEFLMEERYFLPMPAIIENRLNEDFVFGAEDFTRHLRDAVTGTRRAPLSIGREQISRHRIEVTGLPVGLSPPEAVSLANRAFSFGFVGQSRDDDRLTLEWTYHATARSVQPEHVPELIRHAETLADNVSFVWDIRP